jgi:multidrug efflux pump subunit AcrA (membrane-fusion protein)
MEIVPNKKELIIEARIETSDIDSVHLDQLANIQLLAYSSRKTPLLVGKIIYISEDVIEDTTEPGAYYYLCHIKVNVASLADLSKDILLFPGMPITAFIQTRARTFMDFILEPIITHTRRALRED